MKLCFKNIRGFSLVEMMVALTIGLIILAAVANIFATSRSTYAYQEGMARVQEGGRFAMNYLAQDIRMAGYSGCNSLSSITNSSNVNNMASPTSPLTTFTPSGIQGFRYTGAGGSALTDWTPNLPGGFFTAGQVRPYTDVIIIQRGSNLEAHLANSTLPTNANLQILNTTQLAQLTSGPNPQVTANSVLMISDCNNADIFRATNVSSGSGKITIAHSSSNNTANFLAHSYYNNAQLMVLVSRAYYIGTNTANGEPALFRVDLPMNGGSAQSVGLVDEVETMKLLYGEDTDIDGVTNIYRVPASVANWQNVIDVRIGVVVRTPTSVDTTPDTNSYHVLGLASGSLDTFTPSPQDNRRRWVFTSTVRVRNHITN